MQIIILYILFIIVNLVFCTVHLEWFNSFFQNRMINKNEEINYFDAVSTHLHSIYFNYLIDFNRKEKLQ